MKKIRVKGQLFGSLIVVMAILVLIFGLVSMSTLKEKISLFVGDDQSKLISQYSAGENILFYLDESSRQAIEKLMPQFISTGYSGCGMQDGVYFWNNGTDSCIPSEQELSNTLFSQLIPHLNFNLKEHRLGYTFPEFKEGDLYLDSQNKDLIGFPFDYVKIKPENEYSFGLRFSQDLPEILFDREVNIISKINIECSQEESDSENILAISDCVAKVIEKYNFEFNTFWDFGESCESDFETFSREYNECARAYDDFCQCDISKEFLEDYEINDNLISYQNNEMDLEFPFDGQKKIPLYKSDGEMQTFEKVPNVPECRIPKRSFKLCNSGLRFNIYLEDRSSPNPVTIVKNGDKYSWDPSSSPDVEKYLIYVAQEDLDFSSEPTTQINRAFRSSEKLEFDVQTGQKIKVIPRDYVGNTFLKSE